MPVVAVFQPANVRVAALKSHLRPPEIHKLGRPLVGDRVDCRRQPRDCRRRLRRLTQPIGGSLKDVGIPVRTHPIDKFIRKVGQVVG